MIYPEGDAIRERVNNRYSLVVLAAKRAKQIKEGSPVLIETLSTNPLTIALEEIAVGKVTYTEAVEPVVDDDAAVPAEQRVPQNAAPGHDFLSVSSGAPAGNEQASGAIPAELAAFLPSDEVDTLDNEESDGEDEIDGVESLDLSEKAHL